MPTITLYDYQQDAVDRMKNGCILCGGVGSGKSRTSLAYYYILYGGVIGSKKPSFMTDPPDLYIITTARKRDTFEWDKELAYFLLTTDPSANFYKNKVVIDSWNNIKRYANVKDAFFIFDEQRVVGYGAWSRTFIKISKANKWILLSATPGDTWTDYIPVFIANGFYKNKRDFVEQHVVFARNSKYARIDRYLNTGKLIKHRNEILVNMDFQRHTTTHSNDILCEYDATMYRLAVQRRWDIFNDKPIQNAPEFCYTLRKIVNTSEERQTKLLEILEDHPKAIIFYNFDYELEILRHLSYENGTVIAEWNGHEHQPVPITNRWVYLVQYAAGAEGWNCITTDTIIFYSQNYSYKTTKQAAGRIDRVNTPFKELYYYHLVSRAGIDVAIKRALRRKKNFNESRFAFA